MKITEQRWHHWRKLRETPGVVLMMSDPMAAAVDVLIELDTRMPGLPFDVLLAGLAYSNQLGERYYAVNE